MHSGNRAGVFSDTQTMGMVRLGNAAVKVPWKKLPDDSGWFLYCKLNEQPVLVDTGAALLAKRIQAIGLQNPILVTPEASTISLAEKLQTDYGIDTLVIYKSIRDDDIDPVSIGYHAVTSQDEKRLFLGRNQLTKLQDRDIVILDSICTTGGTLQAVWDLLVKAGIPAARIRESEILFVEGEPRGSISLANGDELPIHSFSRLPIRHAENMLTSSVLDEAPSRRFSDSR